MRYTQEEKNQAIENLRSMLSPGDTVHTILKHVSRSGMYRVVQLVIVDNTSNVRDISWYAAKLIQGYDERHGGCKISGCGMDVGFEAVYTLGRVLYPQGFDCLGDNCHSNDHSNRVNSYHHTDGGYAFKQRWL